MLSLVSVIADAREIFDDVAFPVKLPVKFVVVNVPVVFISLRTLVDVSKLNAVAVNVALLALSSGP